TMKYYQGDKEVTSAYDVVWGKVDKVYLAVAGIEGAVTGGGSVVRKYAVQGSAELVKASWDYDKGGNNHIFSKTTDKTVGGVLLNASAGQAAKSTGELVELGVESSTKTALNQAKREAISIKAARGHTPSSSKVAYNDAILSVHRRTIANNSVVGKVANKMTAGQRTGAVKTVGVSISVAKTQVVSKAQTEIKKNTPKR
ncbi:MAG TPA: hypothetical protein PK230_05280, partial [Chitinophagales bacterium]|nr:hypothetical protein [Chitinophagales bacterium]